MKITRNKGKRLEQNLNMNKNLFQNDFIVNLDYSVQNLYEILIKNPFLVNQKDNKGETLLSYAIERDKNEIFDLLLTSPVLDLNYQNKEGNSYLHLSVQFEREEMVSKLIKKGIFLNFQNNDGNTALHFAHLIGNKNIINLLNNTNIDFTIKNNLGKIAEQESENNEIKTSIIFDENSKNNDNEFNNVNHCLQNYNQSSSEFNKTIQIEWSDDNVMKINRKLHLSLSNNLTSNNNQLNSYQIYKKNINNFKSKSLIDNSKKIYKKQSINLDEDEDLYSLSSSKENQRKSNLVKIKNINSTTQTNTNCNYNQTNKMTEDDDIVNINQYNNEISGNYNKKHNISISFKSKNNSLMNNIIDLNIDKNINNERINYQKMFSDTNSTIKTTKPKIEITEDFGFSSPYVDITQQKIELNKNNQINNNQNIINENLINQNNIIKNNNNLYFINENYSSENICDNNQNNSIDINNQNILNKNNIKKNIIIDNNNNQNIINEDNNNNENNFEAVETKLKLSLPDIRKIQYFNVSENPIPLTANNNNSNSKNEINISSQETISSNSLIEFLESINLKKYYKNLSLNGFDDLNLIIEQTKENTLGITNENLKEAGIINPGDRAKIIIKVQELANNFSFNIPKEVYYTCSDIKNADKDKNIIKLNKWLKSINVENLLNNFISNGYHSLELLLIEINCKEPITNQKLRDELNIDKVGFRQRIIIKLSDDSKKFINQLKKNILIIDQKKSNEICNECYIF